MEQPRVPAGNSDGGQWTSTRYAGSRSAPVSLRGDWKDKIDSAMKLDSKTMEAEGRHGSKIGITESGHFTVEDGGQAHIEANSMMFGSEELEEIRAQLDPTKAWRIGSSKAGFVVTNLGDRAEWEHLMGGDWVREYRRNEALSFGDKNRVNSRSMPYPKVVGGLYSNPDDLIRRGEFMMTPSASIAASERIFKANVENAFEKPTENWQPPEFAINKSRYIPSTEPGGRGTFVESTPQEIIDQVTKLRAERVAAHAELVQEYKTPEGYIAALQAKTRAEVADTSPAQVMTGKTLQRLLDGEPLKNYQEGVKSGVSNANKEATAYNYIMKRSMQVDGQGFGIPITAPGSERPIHGLITGKEAEHIATTFKAGSQYGGRSPVMVVYKDDVKSGATITIGDSLDAAKPPVPYDNPHWRIHAWSPQYDDTESSPKRMLEIAKEHSTIGKAVYYNEVQYHRRPTAKDIKHVVFAKEPTAAVRKKLLAQGISYNVVTLPDE